VICELMIRLSGERARSADRRAARVAEFSVPAAETPIVRSDADVIVAGGDRGGGSQVQPRTGGSPSACRLLADVGHFMLLRVLSRQGQGAPEVKVNWLVAAICPDSGFRNGRVGEHEVARTTTNPPGR